MTDDSKNEHNTPPEFESGTTGIFSQYETDVLGEWLDYNGHMNDAAYALVLTAANEAFLDYAEIGAGYRAKTGCTMYTVEAHIYYLAEVRATDHLTARTVIAELAAKKLQLTTTQLRTDGQEAARGEFLYLHYDQRLEKVIPFPEAVFARLQKLADLRSHLTS
jgi:acyl-CoA thioester hydrolase